MRHPGRALDLKTRDLIGHLWTSLFIVQSECFLYYLFCIQLPLFCTVLRKNCTVLNQSESSNFFMYIIRSEIIRVISKSNERAARVRFEITSMISDQNCTPLSSITTLLNPFWNRPNTGLGQFKYFIDAELRRFLNKKPNRKRFYFNTQ